MFGEPLVHLADEFLNPALDLVGGVVELVRDAKGRLEDGGGRHGVVGAGQGQETRRV